MDTEKIETNLREFYEKNIGNSDNLIYFTVTENLECKIQKNDGSWAKIPKLLLDTYDSDSEANQTLLNILKNFNPPKSI